MSQLDEPVDEEWSRLVAEHRVDVTGEREMPSAQTIARHYAQEFAAQGTATDPCIDKIMAYKDAQSAYQDARHVHWEAVLQRTIAKQQVRISVLARNRCMTPSCFAAADREIAQNEADVAKADEVVHETATALTSAADARHSAIDDLKDCRQHHPYEHACGERGGPGVRRPDGKCAAWSDLEH